MIQRRENPCLAREPRNAFCIACKRFRQQFDSYVVTEFRVGGAIDFTKAAQTQMARDFKMRQSGPDHVCQKLRHIVSE
jgi:hypothetical protein